MRQIGTIPEEAHAERFRDYLLTLGTQTTLDPDDGGWAVWVHDEDRVDAAREAYKQFLASPDDPQFVEAGRQAAELREQQIRQQRERQKKQVDLRSRWERPLLQTCPATFALMGISLLIAVISLVRYSQDGQQLGPMDLGRVHPSVFEPLAFWPPDILKGQIWRIFSPMIVHFGLWHILFNMLVMRDFGLSVEFRKGTVKFVAMALFIAAVSNLAQYLWSGPLFGGMSGVNYGLFGYIWMKAKYDPHDDFYIHPTSVFLLVAWFVLGFTGRVGNIANFAHGAGLVTGIVLGLAPLAWRRIRQG